MLPSISLLRTFSGCSLSTLQTLEQSVSAQSYSDPVVRSISLFECSVKLKGSTRALLGPSARHNGNVYRGGNIVERSLYDEHMPILRLWRPYLQVLSASAGNIPDRLPSKMSKARMNHKPGALLPLNCNEHPHVKVIRSSSFQTLWLSATLRKIQLPRCLNAGEGWKVMSSI